MKDCQAVLEQGAEDPDGLVSEGDLRHEVDDPLAPGHHLSRDMQEDVGLAGSGHSEEVVGTCTLFQYRIYGMSLLRRKLMHPHLLVK